MNNHDLTWYVQEIVMHGYGAEIEFNALEKTLADADLRQTRLVWFKLTSFLSHAAMISKYVAPIQPNAIKRERMEALRDCLKINSESEVLPRDARDNVEHFDERIDNWVGNSGTILEIVLKDREAFEFFERDDPLVPSRLRIKRVLLLEEMIFISEKRNSQYFELELKPLNTEILRIATEANKWVGESSPYKFYYP